METSPEGKKWLSGVRLEKGMQARNVHLLATPFGHYFRALAMSCIIISWTLNEIRCVSKAIQVCHHLKKKRSSATR